MTLICQGISMVAIMMTKTTLRPGHRSLEKE
jgi:hypothetical protein